jgi:hypothetical protein
MSLPSRADRPWWPLESFGTATFSPAQADFASRSTRGSTVVRKIVAIYRAFLRRGSYPETTSGSLLAPAVYSSAILKAEIVFGDNSSH